MSEWREAIDLLTGFPFNGANYTADEPGFCKSVKLEEICSHGYVLTPGRYVGTADLEDDGEPFEEKMRRLTATPGRPIRGVGEAGEGHQREFERAWLWFLMEAKKKPRLVSAASGRGRTSEVNIQPSFLQIASMNHDFFQQVEKILAPERLDAYRRDGVSPITNLARYLWNMALCESLYPPLQLAEIALRNSLHSFLSARCKTPAWYDVLTGLPPWQQEQLAGARQKLVDAGKPVAPGRMVAELHFGFWTGFFNKQHARTGRGHAVAAALFPHAPRPERDLRKLDTRWKRIRDLRNRVFHHERISHWADLEAQHAAILEIIGWARPELRQMAATLDRFTTVHQQGLNPWLDKLRHHWPETAAPGGKGGRT